MILGGRYVRLVYKGERTGLPFEALQIIGYDNIEKAYKTFVIDSSMTGFILLTGQYDGQAKAYTYAGAWPNPRGGAMPFRSVTRIVGPDEYTSDTFMILPDGTEFKAVEERSTRRK